MLGSRKALEELVTDEIEEDVKTFGDKRRTRIEESEQATFERQVIDEPLTVIFSKNGWVRARQGWGVDPAALSFKEGDALGALIQCRTVDPVVLLDSNGRAYTVEASQLPSARGDGAPASSLVEVQEGGKMLYCVAGKPDTNVLVASTGGYGFFTKLADMTSNRRAGREFMTLAEGETPVEPVTYEEAPGNQVIAVSGGGRMLVFDAAELRAVARGRGVIVMGLEEGEKLVAVAVTADGEATLTGIAPRSGKQKEIVIGGAKFAHHVGHRARMGRVLPEKLKSPYTLRVPAKPEPAE